MKRVVGIPELRGEGEDMATAKQKMDEGRKWKDRNARLALRILLSLAKSGQKRTYQGLDQEIHELYNEPITSGLRPYRFVLRKIGESLNQLSDRWHEEIPPLTALIINKGTGEPSRGVDDFLERYVSRRLGTDLTAHNRSVMIERATQAVYSYARWDDVAAYFEVDPPKLLADPIELPTPPKRLGGETEEHLKLKEHVAAHPELFAEFGDFGTGESEFILRSEDKVDVLFQSDELLLAVEIKAANVQDGELTRGIFQCVKYRAILRAMHHIDGELKHVQAVMVTPKLLPWKHRQAINRLGLHWRKVSRD
jgi:hypothetical protein